MILSNFIKGVYQINKIETLVRSLFSFELNMYHSIKTWYIEEVQHGKALAIPT